MRYIRGKREKREERGARALMLYVLQIGGGGSIQSQLPKSSYDSPFFFLIHHLFLFSKRRSAGPNAVMKLAAEAAAVMTEYV